MGYNDLQPNQTISFNNLASGVAQGYFVAKTVIPVSAKQITKTEANTYVNINTTLPSYADKASNQLVVRSNLQGLTNVFPYTIYSPKYPLGFSTDGGTTWTPYAWTNPVITGFSRIAGNVTRTHIAVTDKDLNKQIYISNDSGVSFHTVSLSPDISFYASDVSMSSNGQYIVVSGIDRNDISSSPPYDNDSAYFRIAVSSNYGASFTSYTSPSSRQVGYGWTQSNNPISVSGDGQYITACFTYFEFQGFPYEYWRPSTLLFRSSNYGASWTQDIYNNNFFQGIALSGTGQYQFVTGYWDKRFILQNPQKGIKGYVSDNYGATFTEKFQDYNSNAPFFPPDEWVTYEGMNFAGISDNGKSMVAATGYGILGVIMQGNSITQLRYASSDYGGSFIRQVTGITEDLNQYQYGLAVGQFPVAGITDSYVALFTNLGYLIGTNQFSYSVNGGMSQWFFKEMYGASNPSCYNKALNLLALSYSYTLYYDYDDTLPVIIGVNSSASACALTATSITVYSSSSSIVVGTELYYDIYGTIQIQAVPSSAPSQNYYRIGGDSIQFSNNYIVNLMYTCSIPYTIDSSGTGSSVDACTYGNPSVSVWAQANYNVPIVGMIFYDSSSLINPYVGGAGWRKFTNGTTNYAGEVSTVGELTNYVTC